MELFCPICQRLLKEDDGMKDVYNCFPSTDSHAYSVRLENDKPLIMKFRLSPGETKLYTRINFVDNFSEVWTRPGDPQSKIRINHAFLPDFSDLPKLEEKIKTYLLFS